MNLSQPSPTMDMPNVMGLAISEPGHAVNGVEEIAIRSSGDHTKTSMVPGHADALKDFTFRTLTLVHYTDLL
jgi:hypothetical protein